MLIDKQLYLNGILVDLPPDTVIALTIQDYNPLTPDTVRVSFSNRIRIPFTALNVATMQMLNNLKSTSQLYKTLIPARYVQNGVEIIPNGYIKMFGTGSNYFDCALYSSGLDLLSKLRDRQLIDTDYRDVNGARLGAADFLRLSISGGMAYTGKVTLAAAELGGSVTSFAAPNVQIASAMTFFGYQALIEKIITQANFTYDYGSFGLFDPPHVASSPRYRFLAIAQGNKKYLTDYSDKFKKRVEFIAQNSADQPFPGGVASKVLFDTTVESSPFWDLVNDKYIVTNTDTALQFYITNFQVNCAVTLTGPGGSTARVMVYLNGAMIGFSTVPIGTTTVALNVTQALKNGDFVEVYVDSTNVLNGITVKAGITFSNNNTTGGGVFYYYFNEFLPEGVTQLDLFKDMLFRFGQMPKYVNNKVYFKYIVDILNDQTNIIDWTSKRDLYTPESLQYSITQLALTNYYRYTIKETDVLNSRYAEGFFSLDDGNLQAEKTTTSPVIASQDVYYNGLYWMKIPVMDPANNQTFKTEPGFRLANMRSSYAYEPPIKYDVAGPIGGGGYFVANFLKGDGGITGLAWDSIFNEEYIRGGTSFFSRLKNAKYTTRFYNLNDRDIQNLDPHKMIFDDGDYLMFPVIKNYIPGKATEVTLLKI